MFLHESSGTVVLCCTNTGALRLGWGCGQYDGVGAGDNQGLAAQDTEEEALSVCCRSSATGGEYNSDSDYVWTQWVHSIQLMDISVWSIILHIQISELTHLLTFRFCWKLQSTVPQYIFQDFFFLDVLSQNSNEKILSLQLVINLLLWRVWCAGHSQEVKIISVHSRLHLDSVPLLEIIGFWRCFDT